jgi:hypothetical protein
MRWLSDEAIKTRYHEGWTRLRCKVTGFPQVSSFVFARERSLVGPFHDRWLANRTPPSPRLHGLRNENAKVITIALGPLQRLIALCAISLVTNFPTIHGRLVANVRAFLLCSLFPSFKLTDGPTGICYEIGAPSLFQTA